MTERGALVGDEDSDLIAGCPCWDCRLGRAADRALAGAGAAVVGDLVLVADTVITEVVARRLPVPDTYRMVRSDGRTVHVYRHPEGVVR